MKYFINRSDKERFFKRRSFGRRSDALGSVVRPCAKPHKQGPTLEANTRASSWAPGPSCMLWRYTALVSRQEHAHPIHRRPPGSVKLAACRVAVYLVMWV